MISESLEAWMLHKSPSGDTSVQATFFTREKGIVSCLCKGGRTPKKQALLQPFLPLWIAVDTRKNWHYLRHIESTTSSLHLQNKALFAGLYLNELLYYVLKPQDPYPILFEMYQNTLKNVTHARDQSSIEKWLRRFEWELLLSSGYAITFHEEANGAALLVHQYYQFIPESGFVLAERGITGAQLLMLAEGNLEDEQVLLAAKKIMRQAIHHLLNGRELKSRTLFLKQSSLHCSNE